MMRMIMGVRKSDRMPIEELLKTTNFMSVNQMTAQHTLGEMFNIVHHVTIPSIHSSIMRDPASIVHQTRSTTRAEVSVPLIRKEKMKGFSSQGPKLWNMLPMDVRAKEKKETFKKAIKCWVKKSLPI